MKFVDTHVHWYVEDFRADLPGAIARAQEAGVGRFVLPAVSRATHAPLMRVARDFEGLCFPCVGLHPTEVKDDWRSELAFVEAQLATAPHTFVAIGETGIDAYWSRDFIAAQQVVFEQQLRWSARYDLPVIVHARDAFDIIFNVLEKVHPLPLRGVFHAYSGTAEQFRQLRRYGNFLMGVGGVVTFKKAALAQTVEQTDLCDMVLETDAPWLAPAPFRGKRNESGYIPLIAEKVAALKRCPVEEIAAVTTANAESLFNLT
ncbi:MAG: TatD family hydrolase [Prevotellaceae bacterium]|nr:TatD family hydrolase [Prevotellaceae bacterium]